MSQWTHVAGIVRVDGIEFIQGNIRKDLENRFGKTCQFESSDEEWEVCDVPCGSEGSIQYKIDRTGRDGMFSWGVVYIWGDLRDFNDQESIYQWIKKACDDLFVRSCCVKVDIESGGSYIIYSEWNDKELDQIVMKEL